MSTLMDKKVDLPNCEWVGGDTRSKWVGDEL